MIYSCLPKRKTQYPLCKQKQNEQKSRTVKWCLSVFVSCFWINHQPKWINLNSNNCKCSRFLNVKHFMYLALKSLTHSITHSLAHSLMFKRQRRLHMVLSACIIAQNEEISINTRSDEGTQCSTCPCCLNYLWNCHYTIIGNVYRVEVARL